MPSKKATFSTVINSYIAREKLTVKNRVYSTHYNGDRPFIVVVNNANIYVYTYQNHQPDIENIKKNYKQNYTKFVLKTDLFDGYWTGVDTSDYKFHGTTILVKISANRYIFIGNVITQFNTDDEIVTYVSYVGNNAVPYPIAFGVDNLYFMLDNQYVKREEFTTAVSIMNSEKLYQEFYGSFVEHVGLVSTVNKNKIKCMIHH